MGIGTMISILSEPLIRRLINSHPKDPETGRPPPEATASVMTIGAILTPIGQLVFAWTCVPPVHWAVGIAFGIPFGAGNTLSFIYGSNYLAGAYGIYAASALAGNAVMRSIFGGTLPLVAPAMYRAMTPQWAGTFLGLLQVALIPIPFVFYRYGARIRAKSKVIQQLREDGIRNEGQIVRSERRPRGLDERHTATAVAPGGRRGGDEQDVDGGDEDLISPVSDGGHGLDEKDPKKGREWEAERDAVAKSWKEKDTAAV